MVFTGKTDGQLLAEFVATGSQVPFEEVTARHSDMVLRVCRRALPRRHDAEDARQQVYFILSQKASLLTDRPSLAGWLHRVACHVSRRYYRATRVRQSHEWQAAQMAPATRGGFQDCEELRMEVHRALELLPDIYREPLVLHHLEGRTVEEAAAMMECKVGTVAARLSRGREMLRQRIAARGALLPSIAVVKLLSLEGEGIPVPAAYAAAPAKTGVSLTQVPTVPKSGMPFTHTPEVAATLEAPSVGMRAYQISSMFNDLPATRLGSSAPIQAPPPPAPIAPAAATVPRVIMPVMAWTPASSASASLATSLAVTGIVRRIAIAACILGALGGPAGVMTWRTVSKPDRYPGDPVSMRYKASFTETSNSSGHSSPSPTSAVSPIPEPGSFTLLGAGAILFLRRRRP